MTVKNGKHKLVGLVNLGGVHTAMRTLSGKYNINASSLNKYVVLDLCLYLYYTTYGHASPLTLWFQPVKITVLLVVQFFCDIGIQIFIT